TSSRAAPNSLTARPIPRASSGSFFAPNRSNTMRRITIMSGPIRFMILAIVIGIKKSRICLFRKKVVERSIHSYRIRKVIFQESDLPHGCAPRIFGGKSSIPPGLSRQREWNKNGGRDGCIKQMEGCMNEMELLDATTVARLLKDRFDEMERRYDSRSYRCGLHMRALAASENGSVSLARNSP